MSGHGVPRLCFALAPLKLHKGSTSGYCGLHIGFAACAVEHIEAPFFGHLPQIIILRIEEDELAAGLQIVIKLALGALDTLKRAKALQMGAAHIGNQTAVGLGKTAKLRNLARMVGSGLHYGQIVFGTQAKEGQGHTNVVVEIALGIMYVVFAAKDGGQEFLGGGLSVGSGYLDHGPAPLSAVPCRQLLEGGQDIIHQHKTGISGRDNRPVVHHSHCTPLLQRLPGILVAIERFATKREKHTARRTFSAVRGYHRMFLINPVKRCDIHLHFSYFII